MKNRYLGRCISCKAEVGKYEGTLRRSRRGRYYVLCSRCANAPSGYTDNSSYEDSCCGDLAYEDSCARRCGL